ncbi:MAG: hydroxymethylbilane synthase [Candidatus Dormibacteraeota bacterium]|nr:hydroxymethylbilane synthase [Candidatus Dormibacteraeota bacterium]
MRFRVATRGSKLAMAQSRLAVEALGRRYPEHAFTLEPVATQGDRRQSLALTNAPQEGIFVKELEGALLGGRAELAVHSLKDLPTRATSGLTLAAYLPRADARDVLVSRDGSRLMALQPGARVGTGSPRRMAQLLAARADLRPVPIRGNVDTRLGKVAEGVVDAIVLAAAGVARLERTRDVHDVLPFEVMLPAPGQGALVLQAVDGSEAARLAAAVDDPATRRAVEAERAVLRGLGGGCLSAIGAYGEIEGRRLRLRAIVLTEDGTRMVRAAASGADDGAVVAEVVSRLRAQGAIGLLGLDDSEPEAALRGLRVMVTRPQGQAAELSRLLADRGADVVRCPVIVIEPLPVDVGHLRLLDRYDWIVFTSANGVERFFELLAEARTEMPAPIRVAAIGPETAARLEQRGLTVAIVPERYQAEDLATAMPAAMMAGARVLLPRAAGARDVLPDRLRAQGATVEVIETYRAVPPPGLAERLPALLADVDVVTLTSSSTVRNFVAAIPRDAVPAECRIACIGPITAATAHELGLRVDIIAQEYTARGLVDALVRSRTSMRA